MKKLKKKYISFILVLFGCLSLFGVCLKVGATTERNVINIENASNVFGVFRVNYITLQETPNTNYPLFRFSYTYDNNNVIVDINQKFDSTTGKIILSSPSGPTSALDVDNIYAFWIKRTGTYLAIKIFMVYYDYNAEIFKLSNDNNLIYENIERNEDITNLKMSTYSLFYGSAIYGGDYAYTNQQILNIINESINYDFLAYDAIEAYNQGYDYGLDIGYERGYEAGQQGENAISPVFNLLEHIFTILGAIFTIELAPHVPLGVFLLVPLFFAIGGLILWIWRRN